MDDDSEDGANWSSRDIVIDCLYAFAIGVNVYLIVDQLTDGGLTRSLSLSLSHLRGRIGGWIEKERTVRKEYPHVLFDAITIVDREENK